jgi:hypothetical protein
MSAGRQLIQARCAVINCRKRSKLITVKGISFGLIVEYLLCEEHEREHHANLHESFREHFSGVDFVDPERN